jgi:UDP-glucose 4-epimerase
LTPNVPHTTEIPLEEASVLVTGGTGFIGSHTIVDLLEHGCRVVAVDNLSNSSTKPLSRIKDITGKSVEFIEMDVCDEMALDDLFSKHKFSAVIHFAGLKAVGESTTIPLCYFQNNISGTISLLRVMDRHEVRRLIFSSSATVYEASLPPPFREDAPLGTSNPYGKSKLLVEELCREMTKYLAHWRIVLLRYFNPVGAHPSGHLGEDPVGIPNNLLPFAMQVAIGLRPQLVLFGNDYPTPDGTCIRDYIHVVDLARAHVAALKFTSMPAPEAAPNKSYCEAINIGTGNGSSVLEIIQQVSKALGRDLPYVVGPRRPGDAAVAFSDPSKAKRLLGWQAQLTLEDMCRDSWRWQQQNPNGYR